MCPSTSAFQRDHVPSEPPDRLIGWGRYFRLRDLHARLRTLGVRGFLFARDGFMALPVLYKWSKKKVNTV